MQRVISNLLGCAAALAAVTGVQAADLPIKAKPVEYVKVCSLYGAGFWYVPGTDTCLKIGAYIRTQAEWNADGGGVPLGAGNTYGRADRVDNSDFGFRSRQAISVDLRTQTEYGTLRSYLQIGAQVTAGGNTAAGATAAASDAIFVDRGFVQFAGFTVGRIRSYFDINSFAPYSYGNSRISGDTGAAGIVGWAYTAQLGNGVTASLSFEDSGAASSGRGRFVVDGTAAPWAVNAATTYDNRGVTYPDVVGALRIDQAWGYAQVSAALHDVAGGYYGTANVTTAGHPSDKLGWAVSGGFTLNNVLGLKGDQFGMQAAYSQGAIGYVTRATSAWQMYSGSTSVGLGWLVDGVFDTGTNIELTEAWGINGFYQHTWNPKWKTSVYGGYVEINYNSNATNIINGHLPGAAGTTPCGVPVAGSVWPPLNIPVGGGNSCSPSFSWWQVGSRTQWNPHPDLDIGVDVTWTHLNTAYKGSAAGIVAANGARPAANEVADQDIASVMFRVQRNFLP